MAPAVVLRDVPGMSDLLLARARSIGGAFAWRDAAAMGLRPRELAALVRHGEVVRVGPRAYVLTEALDAARSPERRHGLLTLAQVRAFGDGVAASHHSAAALHGLPFWKVDTDTVELARVSGRSTARRKGLRIHEAYPPTSLLRGAQSGAFVVTPALAVIGTAMLHGEEAGVVAADHALRTHQATKNELVGWLDRLRHHRGLAAARRAVAAADGSADSVGESRTRLVLKAMPDLPEIRPQLPFVDESGHTWAYADFGIGPHLVVEFDGRKKYRVGAGRSTAEVEQVLWSEKQREDRIRAERRVVVRVVWSELDAVATLQAKVRAALREAVSLYGPAAMGPVG